MLGDAPVGAQPALIHARVGDRAAGRRDPHELALVGAGAADLPGDAIALADHVGDLAGDVGEGRAEHLHEPGERALAANVAERAVADEVGVDELRDAVDVAGVDDVVDGPDELLRCVHAVDRPAWAGSPPSGVLPMWLIACSASAVIVRLGFTPTLAG